ncbi:uncharacterized protein (DUF885 family) [Williamsia limnetica]|uniref:Uncharacterized protein (DUF885 family) n=1 Tax=Williamsia limnetica TaxID=882452 RepID=A0A318RUU3_WILLI|nr:DUF885 domain-containing protein [Williamsia limnetica]PYE21065.1 uncharacterized protein (DUF885 family) [Williamsia limnetica]
MTRAATGVDHIADGYLERSCALNPIEATHLGVTGHDHLLTDFSPAGEADRATARGDALAALAGEPAADDVDRVTVATMSDQLRRSLAIDDAGLRLGEVNVIESPLQSVRDVFDLMPTSTAAEQDIFLARLAQIPGSVDSIISGLRYRLESGPPLTSRQVGLVAEQADTATASIFSNASAIESTDQVDLLDDLRGRVGTAMTTLAAVLREEVLPRTTDVDAVGRDRYQLHSAEFVGTDIDVDDAYAWGLDLLESIVAEQEMLAEQIAPGEGIAGALAALNADPRYQMTDRNAFVAWMQDLSDRATAEVGAVHFDIPAELTALECRLAPSATGIIYYTMPSENLSRPGRMWWSVPQQQNVFHTWQETTTVFHEGVPGHHLQLGSAMVSPELNRWRKLASFTSGHGEGWALYAERLMGELGWLDDAGDRMGMLDSQRLRAARVVVDIGVHCGLQAPRSVGGGIWDAEKAWAFLAAAVAMDRTVLRFELNRYLGWPGQAPSYALGQRVWQQARTTYARTNPTHSLKDFHNKALALGGVSLDVLQAELG